MRKPIEMELKGLQTPRERIWAALQTFGDKPFTKDQVQDRCLPMVSWTAVEDYFEGLEAAGYIQRSVQPVKRRNINEPMWFALVLSKCKCDAPRLTKDGKPVLMGMVNEAMWRAMKVLPTFDHHDIAKAATLGICKVSPGTAKTYVRMLACAGYLATVRPARPGTAAKHQLVKNTGPHAPSITRRKAVFDRNVGEFVDLQTAQEVCDDTQ